jgi:hypothetical protein
MITPLGYMIQRSTHGYSSPGVLTATLHPGYSRLLFTQGRFFAELTRRVIDRLEQTRASFAEYRLTIMGTGKAKAACHSLVIV